MGKASLSSALAATRLRGQVMELARRLRREADSDEETWSRLLLLGAIDRHGNQATPGRLAAAEGMRSSNLAKALRELEARGLITRQPAQEDRRQVQVALTKTGRQALHAVRRRRDRWLSTTLATLLSEAERQTLFTAGELLARLARADGPPATSKPIQLQSTTKK